MSNQILHDLLSQLKNSSYLNVSVDTFYWKKTSFIKRAVPWFDFDNCKSTKINAFRLLTLEMWCHIKNKDGVTPKICNHSVDYTARRQYFT
jgi:hypothetical protein